MPTQITNFNHLIQNKGTSLNSLAKKDKDKGELKVRSIIAYLITDLISYFNVAKTIDKHQLKDIIDIMVSSDEFNKFTPEQMALCFNRAKMGNYGSVNEKLDGQMLFNWLRKFDSELTIEYEKHRQEESSKHKEDWGKAEYNETYLQILNDVVENIKAKKNQIKKPQRLIVPTKEDEIINDLHLKFKKLHRQNGIMQNSIEFIKQENNYIDRDTFVKNGLIEFHNKINTIRNGFIVIWQENEKSIGNNAVIDYKEHKDIVIDEYIDIILNEETE